VEHVKLIEWYVAMYRVARRDNDRVQTTEKSIGPVNFQERLRLEGHMW
jgi:hypothetical protein